MLEPVTSNYEVGTLRTIKCPHDFVVICFVVQHYMAWWRHQMETFSALLAICAGNSPVPGEFPTQRPVTRSFDVFLDLRLNKQLSKQSWGWWFETLSCPLWRHHNGPTCWDLKNKFTSTTKQITTKSLCVDQPLTFPWCCNSYLHWQGALGRVFGKVELLVPFL